MKTLTAIKITRIYSREQTSAFEDDDVYYMSFVKCGDHGHGTAAPSTIPFYTDRQWLERAPSTLEIEHNNLAYHPTNWYLYRESHRHCCQEEASVVSGPVFLFDDEGNFRRLGKIISLLVSAVGAVTIGVGLVNPVAGLITWAVGAVLIGTYSLYKNFFARDEYLGGFRIEVPCQSQSSARVDYDFVLSGDHNGIITDQTTTIDSSGRRRLLRATRFRGSKVDYDIRVSAFYS